MVYLFLQIRHLLRNFIFFIVFFLIGRYTYIPLNVGDKYLPSYLITKSSSDIENRDNLSTTIYENKQIFLEFIDATSLFLAVLNKT